MPHADSSLIPPSITSKAEFWSHVHSQLEALLGNQRNWVSNLSNAAALVYHSLRAFPAAFGTDERAVNWCGFYIESSFFPGASASSTLPSKTLYLGPFNGRPACQFILCKEGKGVCADAFLKAETLLVADVESYPGHIACDGETKSEIVVPVICTTKDGDVTVGVMDLDCLALNGFDKDDREGLERIATLLATSCDWLV